MSYEEMPRAAPAYQAHQDPVFQGHQEPVYQGHQEPVYQGHHPEPVYHNRSPRSPHAAYANHPPVTDYGRAF